MDYKITFDDELAMQDENVAGAMDFEQWDWWEYGTSGRLTVFELDVPSDYRPAIEVALHRAGIGFTIVMRDGLPREIVPGR